MRMYAAFVDVHVQLLITRLASNRDCAVIHLCKAGGRTRHHAQLSYGKVFWVIRIKIQGKRNNQIW
jgi:hypothetical protein